MALEKNILLAIANSQSNGVGADVGSGYTAVTDESNELMWNGLAAVALADPMILGATIAPAFANRILEISAKRTCVVNCAASSTYLQNINNDGTDWYYRNELDHDDPTTRYGITIGKILACKSALEAAYPAEEWQIVLCMIHGEQDASYAADYDGYKTALLGTWEWYKEDLGSDIKIIVNMLKKGGSAADNHAIRKAQYDAVTEIGAAAILGYETKGFDTIDTTHYTRACQDEMGIANANFLLATYDYDVYARCPRIISGYSSSGWVYITIDHSGGADILPASGMVGVDSSTHTITNLQRHNENTIKYQVNDFAVTPCQMRYLYGTSYAIDSIIKDDNGYPVMGLFTSLEVQLTMGTILISKTNLIAGLYPNLWARGNGTISYGSNDSTAFPMFPDTNGDGIADHPATLGNCSSAESLGYDATNGRIKLKAETTSRIELDFTAAPLVLTNANDYTFIIELDFTVPATTTNFLNIQNDSTNYLRIQSSNTGSIYFWIRNSGTDRYARVGNLAEGKKIIVARKDGSVLDIFFNGVKQEKITDNAYDQGDLTLTAALGIVTGAYQTNIYHVAIYGRAMSDADILEYCTSSYNNIGENSTNVMAIPSVPTITSVDPVAGAEGDTVKINGEFHNAYSSTSSIKFGLTDATGESSDATGTTATAPAGTGIVDVTVTNDDGESATLAGGFRYGGSGSKKTKKKRRFVYY